MPGDGKKIVVPLDEVMESLEDHPGVQNDRRRRSMNVAAGHALCERCDGTGNQLYAMYQRCRDCDGFGYQREGDVN